MFFPFFFSFLFAPKRVLFNAFSSGSICLLFNFCGDFIYGIRKRWPLWTNRPHKTASANSSMENGNITHLDLNFMSNVDNIKRNVYERQQKRKLSNLCDHFVILAKDQWKPTTTTKRDLWMTHLLLRKPTTRYPVPFVGNDGQRLCQMT